MDRIERADNKNDNDNNNSNKPRPTFGSGGEEEEDGLYILPGPVGRDERVEGVDEGDEKGFAEDVVGIDDGVADVLPVTPELLLLLATPLVELLVRRETHLHQEHLDQRHIDRLSLETGG